MDSLSSCFLSPLPHSKQFLFPRSTAKPLFLHISCVRIEERPETTTILPSTAAATTTEKCSQPLKKLKKSLHPIPARRRAEPSFLATVFAVVDDVINKFIDPPRKPSTDPRYVLSDNFAPVDELPPTECQVIQGSLPSCLDGAYLRNGPNPQFPPRGPYHLFDGDGMLHSVKISRGKAVFCSRYVKTYKYMIEKEAGHPLLPNIFSGFNGVVPLLLRGALAAARIIAGQYNPIHGIGLANTGLVFFGGSLYALGESDLPYAVKVDGNGDIITLGRRDFDGKLSSSMTAHPKIDPLTGEVFAFRYGPKAPFLTYFRFDLDGSKQPDLPVLSMTRPAFVHDFAITKNYAVFPDIQIGMNLVVDMVMRGGSLMGSDPRKVPRIGIIPRYTEDEAEMRWFEVPGFNILHVVNAWEEDGGDTVVMVAPNILPVEHALERIDLIHSSVEKVRVDLMTGTVTRQSLSSRNLDFGVINPDFVAQKNRYAYAAAGGPMPKASGVVKLDLTLSDNNSRDCIVASRMYGPGCFGGEPFFVAREPENRDANEDDGYLVAYVHNENANDSRFVVMDAKSPSLEIVASVKLPRRVPYGFHGIFIREKDL